MTSQMHQVVMVPGAIDVPRPRSIVWLLSNEASYTTGGFIDVTGGR